MAEHIQDFGWLFVLCGNYRNDLQRRSSDDMQTLNVCLSLRGNVETTDVSMTNSQSHPSWLSTLPVSFGFWAVSELWKKIWFNYSRTSSLPSRLRTYRLITDTKRYAVLCRVISYPHSVSFTCYFFNSLNTYYTECSLYPSHW